MTSETLAQPREGPPDPSQRTFEDLQAENGRLVLEIAEERRILADALAQLRSRESELSRLRSFDRARKRELEQLRDSTSWRLTAPIRVLKAKAGSLASLAWRAVRGRLAAPESPVADVLRLTLGLGFVERGTAELARLAQEAALPSERRDAAWELAVWHLNQGGAEHARKALPLLRAVAAQTADSEAQRRVAIMLAEARQALGDATEARRLIEEVMAAEPHPDLSLAMTALEPGLEGKARWINDALARFGIAPVHFTDDPAAEPYDRLATSEHSGEAIDGPLVTVIMPAYNGAPYIGTAIRSLLAQTYRRFELLVVDDCSTDDTREVVQGFVDADRRVRLLSTPRNSGPYVARNIALDASAGALITCNDADDWSHPRKLEIQVRHLVENPKVVANFSEQARVGPDMAFHRRAKPGQFVFRNMSSFMFRRRPVLNSLGYWDSVRFGADNEFIKRATGLFGERAVVTLPHLLSFQRQTPTSLTGDTKFGYHGYFAGARKEYMERHRAYHLSGEDLRYQFPQRVRPFPVPEPMWPVREAKPGTRRHFDVILASEFRLKGGSNLSNLEEIRAMRAGGLKVGLVQMSRYELDVARPTRHHIADEVDGDRVQFLVYGEEVSCDLLLVRYPPVLQDIQKWVPDVEAAEIRVIVNQPPMSDYGPRAERRYDLATCAGNIRHYFGKDALWLPIGPAVREALHQHHEAELPAIELSPENWVNIIEIDMWRRPSRPPSDGRARIGRHSRDHEMKWPATRESLLRIYPDDSRYEVCVMGGGKVAEGLLGGLPANWTVLPFDAVPVRDFLAGLDVFVYFTHPSWVESFGRVVIEAMAVGVPVIVPPSYRELFGDAALYAEPAGVLPLVDRLMADATFYAECVDRAFEYVERHFGYAMHLDRVNHILNDVRRRSAAAN